MTGAPIAMKATLNPMKTQVRIGFLMAEGEERTALTEDQQSEEWCAPLTGPANG